MKNYLPNILITGGNGQLAQALKHHTLASHFHLTMCTRDELDITNPLSIDDVIRKIKPSIIINTAAYTAVDLAEKEHQLAMLINHMGAKNLAIASDKYHIPLMHLSTDYVFDGKSSTAYQEDDMINPINMYGLSKHKGEHAIREYCPKHIILRVSGIYSQYGKNFVKTIQTLAQIKNELRIVADQITCPTHANDIAQAIFTMATHLKKFGTYHFCSDEPISWYQFATHITKAATIHGISSEEHQSIAKRPAYSVLNCRKIATDYGIKQPSWRKDFIAEVIA